MKYLITSPAANRPAHVWMGDDTACRMWSTGGMRQKGAATVEDSPGGRRICAMCANVLRRVVGIPPAMPEAAPQRPAAAGTPMDDVLRIWADGACEPNPGIGGWGWLRSDGKRAYGGVRGTTNNRMELTAVLEALKALPDGARAIVLSDSQYVVKGLTIWARGWARKDWMRADKTGAMQPMPNRDLWLALEEQKRRLRVHFEWVRGHNGDAGNEAADALAEQGRKRA